jgi:hypothetical protein
MSDSRHRTARGRDTQCSVYSRYYATTARYANIPDVSTQRLGKHIPAATNRRATIDVLLETGYFYVVRAEGL